jgi:hypothetical protein
MCVFSCRIHALYPLVHHADCMQWLHLYSYHIGGYHMTIYRYIYMYLHAYAIQSIILRVYIRNNTIRNTDQSIKETDQIGIHPALVQHDATVPPFLQLHTQNQPDPQAETPLQNHTSVHHHVYQQHHAGDEAFES